MRCKCAVVCHASPFAMRTAAVRCVLPLVVRLLLKICIIICLIRHSLSISLCALHIISFSETNDPRGVGVSSVIGSDNILSILTRKIRCICASSAECRHALIYAACKIRHAQLTMNRHHHPAFSATACISHCTLHIISFSEINSMAACAWCL